MLENGVPVHVPTVLGNNGYAALNFMTNSVYLLISCDRSFADAAGTWYSDAADKLAQRLIMSGDENGNFNGELGISKAEFAQIIVAAMGLRPTGKSGFSDVPETAWYADAVGAAEKYGIITGDGAGKFYPAAKISRQEAMVMLYKAAALCGETTAGDSADAAVTDVPALYDDTETISDWARQAAYWCVSNGVVKGENYRIRPLDGVSRAETAAMTLRFLGAVKLINYSE